MSHVKAYKMPYAKGQRLLMSPNKTPSSIYLPSAAECYAVHYALIVLTLCLTAKQSLLISDNALLLMWHPRLLHIWVRKID